MQGRWYKGVYSSVSLKRVHVSKVGTPATTGSTLDGFCLLPFFICTLCTLLLQLRSFPCMCLSQKWDIFPSRSQEETQSANMLVKAHPIYNPPSLTPLPTSMIMIIIICRSPSPSIRTLVENASLTISNRGNANETRDRQHRVDKVTAPEPVHCIIFVVL